MENQKVKNPEIKNIIYDIICFSDDVDEKGNKLPRNTFSKTHFKGAASLKKKIIDQIQLGIVDSEKASQVEWVDANSYVPNPQKKIIGERHIPDFEIEITHKEIEALKYYYNDRDELMAIRQESFEEFERLIG